MSEKNQRQHRKQKESTVYYFVYPTEDVEVVLADAQGNIRRAKYDAKTWLKSVVLRDDKWGIKGAEGLLQSDDIRQMIDDSDWYLALDETNFNDCLDVINRPTGGYVTKAGLDLLPLIRAFRAAKDVTKVPVRIDGPPQFTEEAPVDEGSAEESAA
jgi:hypothetical protein